MKKYFNVVILRIVQLVLAAFLSVTVWIGKFDDKVGLTLPTAVQYLPVAASALILVLFATEFFGARPWVRLCYLAVALFACIMMAETLEMLNMTIWLFGLIYMILVIVALVRTHAKASGTEEKAAESKCLPVGIFDKKDLVAAYIFVAALALVTVAGVLVDCLCAVVLWYVYVVVDLAIASAYIVYFVKCNAANKLLSLVNKELSFERFDRELSRLLAGNLHPESVNYLMTLRANYLFAYDKAQGIEQFEKTVRPTARQYLAQYDLVEIVYLINTERFGEAEEAIRRYLDEYKCSKSNAMKLRRTVAVYASEEEIDDVEAIFSTDGKIPVQNLSNAYELMCYYRKRGNGAKAVEYARKIMETRSDFHDWLREARALTDDRDGEAATARLAADGEEEQTREKQ